MLRTTLRKLDGGTRSCWDAQFPRQSTAARLGSKRFFTAENAKSAKNQRTTPIIATFALSAIN